MPYTMQFGDMDVKCDTLDELLAARAALGGESRRASHIRAKRRTLGERDGRSTGVGKGWAVAQWYGLHNNLTPNDARRALRKLKVNQRSKWETEVRRFDEFAKWYESAFAHKSGIDALRNLYLDDTDSYKSAVDQFKRQSEQLGQPQG